MEAPLPLPYPWFHRKINNQLAKVDSKQHMYRAWRVHRTYDRKVSLSAAFAASIKDNNNDDDIAW